MGDDTQVPLLSSNSSATLKSEGAGTTITINTTTATADSDSLQSRRQAIAERTRVGVIGTGIYALALTKRLTMLAGCDVILGSRKPELRRGGLSASGECMCGVELASVSDCLRRCDIIIVAIHKEDFKITLQPFSQHLARKIVVDVSNREYRYAAQSNAEYLASILPGARVVKAFNSVSAHAMEDVGHSGYSSSASSMVYVAGNDPGARGKVMELGQAMGFRVADLGPLTSARWMEDFVLKMFPHWKIPVFLAFGIFNLWTLFIVYIYFIERDRPAFEWEQLFLKVLNKPLCMTAITMLALTYLPGQLASILQVYNGTKHRRFPQFLDTWLKSRKQLGLVSFFLVTVHAIASTLMLSPTYYSSWFHKVTVTLPANLSSLTSDPLVLTPSKAWMTWKGEAACAVGILAFVLLAVIALTSIKSVGESLNWSEWRCVHSQLSYAVLALSVAHVCIMGGPGWAKNGFPKTFKSITFLSALLPALVLALKLAFSLPPLSGYLRKIRRGWERSGAVATATADGKKNNNRGVSGCGGRNIVKNTVAFGHSNAGCCGNEGNSSDDFHEKNSAGGVSIVITDAGSSGKDLTGAAKLSRDLVDDDKICCGGNDSSAAVDDFSSVRFSSPSTNKSLPTQNGDNGCSPNSLVTVVDLEPRYNTNEQPYTGVSLHKDCTCAEQSVLQASFPQCQCSSV